MLMIIYKLLLVIPLSLIYATLYFIDQLGSRLERSKRDKLLTAIPFVLGYLVLYSIPCSLSIRIMGILFIGEGLLFLFLIWNSREVPIFGRGPTAAIVVGLIILLVFSFTIPKLYVTLVGDEEIHKKVNDLVEDEPNYREKVNAILDWEENNIEFVEKCKPFNP